MMKIVVPINLIPDLVEELSIDESGKALDMAWARLIINEFDDHAVEQAILIKEGGGGEVIVLGFDSDDLDDALFTAAAKGADQLMKLTGDFEGGLNSHARARVFAGVIKEMKPDLVLAGVQAHDDLDGQVGPLLAELLGYPYVGYVAGVKVDGGKAIARKEYPGGLVAEMETTLPAVLGIQASETPPRYVAFSKVRQAMQTASIDETGVEAADLSGGPEVGRMFLPEVAERATMIEGSVEEISTKLLEIFKEQGVV
jgi:electron transfer flavoprotein beta subunit